MMRIVVGAAVDLFKLHGAAVLWAVKVAWLAGVLADVICQLHLQFAGILRHQFYKAQIL